MKLVILLTALGLVATANAQGEAEETFRFKTEAMVCAALYGRTEMNAEPGSELAATAKRNAGLFLETAKSAGATNEFILGVMATYTMLVNRALVTPEAQLQLLDQCEAMMDGPPR